MGQHTDASVRAWQRDAGLVPAAGARAARLEEMARVAFELIRVLEREQSGIRDGDGLWHGTDPIHAMIADLQRLAVADKDAERCD